MQNPSKSLAWCSLAVLVALYVVGAVSNGSLRHEVQTLPLWIPIVLGFQGRKLAKWAALPCLLFWLLIMVAIWLFLLGWARIVTGHFSPVEIAMTLVIGLSSIIGIVRGLRWRTSVSPAKGVATVVLLAIFQVGAMRISLIPYIATR
jgi:hypothetical protein